MAIKQTRRSVSLECRLHALAGERADSLAQPLAGYISCLIRADLAQAGIATPPAKHQAQRSRVRPGHDAAAPSSNSEVEEPSLGPVIALARGKMPDMDPKYIQALEHTRRKLDEQRSAPKYEQPVDKTAECSWCGDSFKQGQIPTEHDAQRVHGKCKREMIRTGGVKL